MRFFALFTFVFLGLCGSAAQTAIVATGDIWPTSDPNYWTTSFPIARIGNNTDATITVDDGSDLLSKQAYLGYKVGATGTVTITGADSTWTNPGFLLIGLYGAGYLNVLDGAVVDVGETTWVGYGGTSSGSIHFDNGTLNTNTLGADFAQLSGTGTINTHGFIANEKSLVFDAAHGLQQTLTYTNTGKNITVNLDMQESGYLGAGYMSNGTLTIKDGITVESTSGFLGYGVNASGVATVSGINSTWENSYILHVGLQGHGELNVTDGGNVNSFRVKIGDLSGSSGVVNVSGFRSELDCSGILTVGFEGMGELNITDGGLVCSSGGNIGSDFSTSGLVNVSGADSAWSIVGNLTVGNNGAGTLNITDGGLVSVGGSLRINRGGLGNDAINMSTGGMLALIGDVDDSIGMFLDVVNGTDAIMWWNSSIDEWAPLTTATRGTDYTLEYQDQGLLAGYTLLTVSAVPEPSTIGLVLTAFLAAGLLPTVKKLRHR